MKQIEGAKLHWEKAKNVIKTYKTTSMVFEAGGGGAGGIDVHTKNQGRTTRAAWDRMLYLDPCIYWFKM